MVPKVLFKLKSEDQKKESEEIAIENGEKLQKKGGERDATLKNYLTEGKGVRTEKIRR